MVAYGRLKTKENCKLSSLKVVVVANERCSLTRGSNYSDLTDRGNFSILEVVGQERWSQAEVRVYAHFTVKRTKPVMAPS